MVISNEYLGIVAHNQEKYSQAEEYYQTAYDLCDRIGWKSRIDIYRLLLGSVRIALQDYEIGRKLVLEATSSWIEKHGQKMLTWIAPPEVSFLLERIGKPQLAVALIVKSLEFSGPEFKPLLEILFQEMRSRYPQDEFLKWIKQAEKIKPYDLATATRDALFGD